MKEYDQGIAALKKKDYLTAIQRLNAAISTGHTRPQERFGTSRYSVDLYDPYYWLGVAHMELGRDSEAREYFRMSREAGVIEKHAEFGDLVERTRVLEAREAPLPTPTPPPPSPTPEFRIPPEPERLPSPRTGPRPVLTATPALSRRGPDPPDPADLAAVVQAVAAGRLEDAEIGLARLRARSPDAPETHLLSTVVFGSRYLLDGRRDASLLSRAKQSLESFRRSGGSRRAEEAWLSPALRSALVN